MASHACFILEKVMVGTSRLTPNAQLLVVPWSGGLNDKAIQQKG